MNAWSLRRMAILVMLGLLASGCAQQAVRGDGGRDAPANWLANVRVQPGRRLYRAFQGLPDRRSIDRGVHEPRRRSSSIRVFEQMPR